MKTAILISGHMRTFKRCLPTLAWHVFRHFPDADFFVSTVKDQDAHTVSLLRDRYQNVRIELDMVDAQPELPLPVGPTVPDWTVGRMYGHEPYAISVHPQAILRQLWQLERVWRLMEKTNADGHKYDCFIRCRPDLWFRSFRMPSAITVVNGQARGFSGDLRDPWVKHACTPWYARFGGVNDRFAIMGATAADAYFTTYSRIPKLIEAGCPLHPESLVRASLELAGCHIDDTLRAEFSKLYGPENPKLNGTFRDPEVTPFDIAHLASSR